MIIIADSGSTKTEWILLENSRKWQKIQTPGFNPNYFPVSVLGEGVSEVVLKTWKSEVSWIFYYGSGCTREGSKTIVRDVLKKYFPKAKTQVQNDLFGAARALFGNGSGIASILGTGSSSCLSRDGEIAGQVPSLGYLMADEGSGFHLGKLLINAYFKNQLPEHLTKKFSSEINRDLAGFISDIYADPKPNSTLASFVPFIAANKNEPFFSNLVKKAFRDFFSENILTYRNYAEFRLGFTGSVSYLFQDELNEVARESGLEVFKIIKNPIDGLVKYHLGEF